MIRSKSSVSPCKGPMMSISTLKQRLLIACVLCLGLLAYAGIQPIRVDAAPLLQQSCTLPATVTTATELADCITAANANGAGPDTITLGADITLSADLPQITSAITLEGAGYYVDGESTYRVFEVTSTGDFTVNQITVQNGYTDVSVNGAGIYNAGTLTVTNTTISGNVVRAGYGGGIYNRGTLTVTNSTFSGNSVGGYGGGIYNRSDGTLTVSHSTFSGNTVSYGGIGGYGGGISNSGMLTVTYTTFSGNTAATAGNSIDGGGTVYLAGVILDTGTSGANCSGSMTDNGYNLSDDASCSFTGTGSADNATLNLGALTGTGPGQQVHVPADPSDAIGAIPNGTTINNNGVTLACNSTTTDQIGSTRPIYGGDACTSGAVEVVPPCLLPATVTNETQLAGCITEANANGAGLDTITLGADITLSTTLPQITSEITLEGAGYTVDGASTYRVFEVTSTGNLTVNQITVQNGNQTIGGGIVNFNGTLTVTNSTFSNNNANAGGGVYSDSGTLTVTNSTFSSNSSIDGGGIYNASGTLIVTNSTFSANSANTGEGGGGIYNGGGTATVTHTTFNGNNAVAGGGIYNDGTVYLAGVIMDTGPGGANCSGTMTDNGYNLSDDASCGFTGTGSADNATLNLGALTGTGPGNQVHTPADPSDAIGAIPNGTIINNNGVTLACNSTTTDQIGSTRPINAGTACTSGAVEVAQLLCPTPLAISDTTELDNCINWANANPGADTLGLDADITLSAALPQITSEITLEGGGFFVSGNDARRVFYVANTGDLTINQITVQNGFTSSSSGGGIYNAGTLTINRSTITGNTARFGGGVTSAGTLTIMNSTLSSNTARSGGGAYIGGGGDFTLTNSTLSGNSASDGDGGGVYIGGGGDLTLTNSTLSGNGASREGGGVYRASGTVTLNNSIITNSTSGGDCADFDGGGFNGASNLTDDFATLPCSAISAAAVTNFVPTLADNGGPTLTHALLAGSNAIDAGDNTTCAAAPVNNLDQRGITRPNNTTCDIGAYEAGTLVCGVSAGGTYTFSEQSGVVIEVVNTTDLTCLYVEEVPENHPQATGAEDGDQLKTGKYWRISGLQGAGGTPANSFTANLTLPQAGLANPQACKYTPGVGNGWDCAADNSTSSTVTRNGLTSFSDWTVGTNVPTAVSLQLFTAHPRAIGGWAGLLALVGLLAAISVRFLWRVGSRAL